MATIYYDINGNVLALARDGKESLVSVPAGQHASSPLVFDDASNPTVHDRVAAAVRLSKVVAGVLSINAVNVPIAADAQATTDRKSLVQGAANAITTNNTFIALGSPSNAQIAAQVKALTQQNNQIIKRLLQLTQ